MFRGKSMITDCKQMRKLQFSLAVTSNMQSFKLSNNSTRTCQESSSKNFFGHIKRLTKTGDFEKMLALVFKVKGKYLDQIFKFFNPTPKKILHDIFDMARSDEIFQ